MYRTTAAGLLNLARNVGGSIGISLVTTLLARNIQTSHADLASHITPFSVPVAEPSLLQRFGDVGDGALALLNADITRQAAMVAYIDDFYFMMLVTLVALPLVLLLRKPKQTGSAPPAMAD